jgi:hypothetical protein
VDGGVTWIDVTPRYLGIGQILMVDPFLAGEAEMVALIGPNCLPQALRTFTQGQFWESRSDLLADASYIDPTRPGTVVTPSGVIDAPCPSPAGLRADGAQLALICEGRAHRLENGSWLVVAEDAVAVAITPAGVSAAYLEDDCDGIKLTAQEECVAITGEATPAALAQADPGLVLWSGSTLTFLPSSTP